MPTRAEILSALRDRTITPARARELLAENTSTPAPEPTTHVPQTASAAQAGAAAEVPSRALASAAPVRADEPIAIIGMSGRYPGAESLEEYWELLREGRDAVTEVPEDRWDADDWFDPEPGTPGRTYSRWLGAIDRPDAFDAAHFEITPADAALMEPQQRLVLEESVRALSDAGYGRAKLKGRGCGVYLGIVQGDYAELCLLHGRDRTSVMAGGTALAAARVSYFLDLRGPALSIDTACSSSLVATHLAVSALHAGEIDMALVAGVSLYLSPGSYVAMSQARMLSPRGHCHTFDDDADGFVPGEGVSAVVLRRLSDAERDGDHVHGLIVASGINQDGKSNGITAPNMASQIELLRDIYTGAGLDPADVDMVETHGTGTKLGDPVELQALATAYTELNPDLAARRREHGRIEIGSVKSNLGHASAAAGLAGLQKAILCLRHRRFVPSLHFERPNHHFDFDASPFSVTTGTTPWETTPGRPRRAAISSFGYSGTNAHVVVEEYPQERPAQDDVPLGTGLLVASARTGDLLREYVRDLSRFVRERTDVPLGDVLRTLRERDVAGYRLAVLGDDRRTLLARLDAFLDGDDGDEVAGLHTARARGRKVTVTGAEPSASSPAGRVAAAWLRGSSPDPADLDTVDAGTRRASVPTCPFKRTSYWLDQLPLSTNVPDAAPVPAPVDGAQSYRVRLDGTDPVVTDHVVAGTAILPGAGVAELVRAAARELRGRDVAGVSDTVWLAPVSVPATGRDVTVVLRDDADKITFEVIAEPAGAYAPERIRCAEGRLLLDTAAARREHVEPPAGALIDGATFYARLAEAGLRYGPGFRGIAELGVGHGTEGADDADGTDGTVYARLAVVPQGTSWSRQVGLLDSVLQTISPLMSGRAAVPFTVERVTVHRELGPGCRVRAVRRGGADTGQARFDIVAVTPDGNACVDVRGLVVRPIRPGDATGQVADQGADRAADEGVLRYEQRWWAQAVPAGAVPFPGLTLWLGEDFPASRPPAGERVVVVRPGTSFARLGDGPGPGYQADFTNSADLDRLLHDLEQEGLVPDRVVRAFSADLDDDGLVVSASDHARERAERTGHAAIALAAALVRARIGGRLSRVRVLWCHRDGDPAGAALRGFARTVALESPGFDVRVAAVGPGLDAADAHQRVWAELAVDSSGVAVRWTPEGRFVLGRHEASAGGDTGSDAADTGVRRGFRDHGTYVVVGARGGLGALTARHLAREKRARLVLVGRSPADDTVAALIDDVRAAGGDAVYVAADVSRAADARRVATAAHEVFGGVNGIVHAGGVTRDALAQNLTPEAVDAVLAPKVAGTLALDDAFADEPLDVVVFYSSLASVLGNAGQAVYSYANGFQDAFAAARNARVAAGERAGHTVSISWPYWAEGGIGLDEHSARSMRQAVGITPMPSAAGLAALEDCVRGAAAHPLVVHGSTERVRETLTVEVAPVATVTATPGPAGAPGEAAGTAATSEPAEPAGRESAVEAATALLTEVMARATGLDEERIQDDLEFDHYGIDSIAIMAMTRELEDHLGELSKTLFFEYRTPSALAAHLAEEHADVLGGPRPGEQAAPPDTPFTLTTVDSAVRAGGTVTGERQGDTDKIAVIGLTGRYPMAPDVAALWRNLRAGRDCVTEVPADRWDWRDTFDPDRSAVGTSYTRWGGFIDDVDRFDAGFFAVPPVEAELLDPQVRLFLEAAWHVVEDAGYTPATLGTREVGVFVGVMYGMYDHYRGEIKGTPVPISSSFSAIANRVSYFMDLTGPSMAVDTMCSSSLTALHLAIRSLRSRESELAIAGGVNVTVHPDKHILLSLGNFASADGRCRSFGEGGSGYVPGEGVGAVLLKPLSKALADGDHVYGVLIGSAVNAGGRTNSFTVPSPLAQADVVTAALADSGVDAADLGYLEAHGTGTSLGDPIEITGLARSVGTGRPPAKSCPVGSVKSNIGHLESAAGIAALTKVLLQFQHEELVPSIHAEALNPYIPFDRTPFHVQRELSPWPRPRLAGISSFGAGGANAHLVVEKAPLAERPEGSVTANPQVYVLSARDAERLAEYAERLEAYVRVALDATGVGNPSGGPWQPDADAAGQWVAPAGWGPHAVARTLQLGRVPMRHRLAVVADDLPHLVEALAAWRNGDSRGVRYADTVTVAAPTAHVVSAVLDRAVGSAGVVDAAVLDELAAAWVAGGDVDWSRLFAGQRPVRVPLPGYPFVRDRYWVPDDQATLGSSSSGRLAPLLERNVSDLGGLRFTARFASEFFLADHRVGGEKTLPAVAFVELILEAVRAVLSGAAAGTADGVPPVAVRNLVWLAPLRVPEGSGRSVDVLLSRRGDDADVDVEIISRDEDGNGTSHCRGAVRVDSTDRSHPVSRPRIRPPDGREADGAALYERLRAVGVDHGRRMRSVLATRTDGRAVTALLDVPAGADGSGVSGGFVLHPALADGGLQAALVLDAAGPIAGGPRLPFAVDEVTVHAPLTGAALAVVLPGRVKGAVDVVFTDRDGIVAAELRGVSFRAAGARAFGGGEESLLHIPVWEAAPPARADLADRPRTVLLVGGVGDEAAAGLVDRLGAPVVTLPAAGSPALGETGTPAWYMDLVHEVVARVRPALAASAAPSGMQLVVPASGPARLAVGLGGLLRAVAEEKPGFVTQVVEVGELSEMDTVDTLARLLRESWATGEPHTRRHVGAHEVRRWRAVPVPDTVSRWGDGDVHLVTGGAGGLGLAVAEDIAASARAAVVVLVGRSPLDAARAARLRELSCDGTQMRYEQADVTDRGEIAAVVDRLVAERGRVDVVVHSAGVLRDGLLATRAADDVTAVLAPKIVGIDALEAVTREHGVREYLLFSSMASVTGNLGQSIYGAANGFLDAWAARHNELAATGQRCGRALSLSWPIWADGGMRMPAEAAAATRAATGLVPIPTGTGMRLLNAARALGADHVLPLHGDPVPIRAYLTRATGAPGARAVSVDATPAQAPAPQPAPGADAAYETAVRLLRRILAEELKLPAADIDMRAPLEDFGVSSVLAMVLISRLEETFGSLPKTLFFEHHTLDELAGHLVAQYPEVLARLTGGAPAPEPHATDPAGTTLSRASTMDSRSALARAVPSVSSPVSAFSSYSSAPSDRPLDIAIVGVAGRYPGADDLETLWENLARGRDTVTGLPADRFPPGSLTAELCSRRGGFLAGVAEFDPLFFAISPVEAESMDPQERLFLQTTYHAIEDAGYTARTLHGPGSADDPDDPAGSVGVFVGVMYTEYQLYGAQAQARGRHVTLVGSPASIANRVSYTFGFHGPSVAVDTMCSSSLTALHLACQAIAAGECGTAVAGGVNVSVHPNKFHMLGNNGMISEIGRCATFGADGDGYVPGEGVGAVVLKPLVTAEADGDQIYGVIRGTAMNHGGSTNGYTVPNPRAQAAVVRAALRRSGLDPRAIGYVEAHGTGTSLGDPIEIRGLASALDVPGADRENPASTCLIGSVKSNFGHCESAAGIAGLTKVLLQLRHDAVAPSLHSARLNPHIDFDATRFVVPQALTRWPRPGAGADGHELPRAAGVSAFGAGGSNAHVLVEEYLPPPSGPQPSPRPRAVVLSARTGEQLAEVAARLLAWLRRVPRDRADLRDLARTLQVGREPMAERVAFLVTEIAELDAALAGFVANPDSAEYRGRAEQRNNVLQVFETDELLSSAVDTWLAQGNFGRLLSLWVRGLPVDWTRAPASGARRISLPGYPFARERYWAPDSLLAGSAGGDDADGRLHPLVHRNISTFEAQRYRTELTPGEPILRDHVVAGVATLPAAAVLELVVDAVRRAAGHTGGVVLRDVVWLRPLVAADGMVTVDTTLTPRGEHGVEFDVGVVAGTADGTTSTGFADLVVTEPGAERLDLTSASSAPVLTGDQLYARFAEIGIGYGQALRSVRAVWRHDDGVLVAVEPSADLGAEGVFSVHPAVVDGALQASLALVADARENGSRPALKLPFSVARLVVDGPVGAGWALVTPTRDASGVLVADSVTIRFADREGRVVAGLDDVRYRAVDPAAVDATADVAQARQLGRPEEAGHPGEQAVHRKLLFVPGWRVAPLPEGPAAGAVAGPDARRRFVVTAGPGLPADVTAALPGADVVALSPRDAGAEARWYSEVLAGVLRVLREVLRSPSENGALVQVVCADEADGVVVGEALTAALAGMLRTAHLEDERVDVQVIGMAADAVPVDVETLLRRLDAEAATADVHVRWKRGERLVAELTRADLSEPDIGPWRSDGVYLVTGGLGGLGRVFAAEILERAPGATVVLAGRSPLDAGVEAVLGELGGAGGRRGVVAYRRVDVTRRDEVLALVDGVRADFGSLDGVVHSAGGLDDAFLRNIDGRRAAAVWAPKVLGTCWLDEAVSSAPLDVFCLVGSLAGVTGNVGQAAYAAANAFLGGFTRARAARVADGSRHGRTVAVHWPLWRDGGMRVDAELEAAMIEQSGLAVLDRANGLDLFRRVLAAPHPEVIPVLGNPAVVTAMLTPHAAEPVAPAVPDLPAVPGGPGEVSADVVRERVLATFAEVLHLDPARLDPDEPLGTYGIDSILITKITLRLERELGPLPKTLLFELQTIGAVADRLRTTHAGHFGAVRATAATPTTPTTPVTRAARGTAAVSAPVVVADRFTAARSVAGPGSDPRATDDRVDDRIAVIGMSGVFPQAPDLGTFWRNLVAGRDCVTEIPRDRWDIDGFFDPDPGNPGTSYTRWGGFVDGMDAFDARMFNITPIEAEVMDPQERLFLQCAWATLEDAGYTRTSLGYAPGSAIRRNVGVYVGVMNEEYQHWATQEQVLGRPAVVSGNPSSVANRVSYTFDFHGPSVALDSMCSSSLLAIHLACQAIRDGECAVALAGGVNVLAHPNHFLAISRAGMAATDGRCRSFGAGGDGYVPAEGVGAVLLKPLSEALADGDHVWGVIAGSAVNHGGKTNGYSVPNPLAQTEAVTRALARAGVDADRLDYVEAHGTGTALGDPIELAALTSALGGPRDGRPRVIGSVKSSIGHAESAAGIAGVAKVLLQMRHGVIAPSLHAEEPNPALDLVASGFRVPHQPEPWHGTQDPAGGRLPLVSGVSSFGAGGTNAHVVLEQVPESNRPVALSVPALLVLSARTPDRLRVLAGQLAAHLRDWQPDREGLLRTAYTLQVGREPLAERAAFVADDAAAAAATLEALAQGDALSGVALGNVSTTRTSSTVDARDLVARDVEGARRLGAAWVTGAVIDWTALYDGRPPRRISLPTYPFEPVRHWLDIGPRPVGALGTSLASPTSNGATPDVVPATGQANGQANGDLDEWMVEYLRSVFASVLKLSADELGADTTFEDLGLDSIYIQAVATRIRDDVGKLPATAFFTHKSLGGLARHLVRDRREAVAALFGDGSGGGTSGTAATTAGQLAVTEQQPSAALDIAIIGMSGRYPMAEDLNGFRDNLTAGRDCITEIPEDRWDYRRFPDVECRWGGFLDRPTDFDPQFFGIAPGTAAFLDPQERLFLQATWSCLEDAGYTPRALGNPDAGDGRGDVAVFAGVTFNQYGLFGAEELARGNAVPLNSQIFSVANRVSYLLNLRGPSLAVDTACSSSLYAVHLACEALRHGEADLALAGGVNLTLHPSKYVTLAWNKLLASDGHCRAFGAGGDGYVPGEGVGAVLLKPLRQALADGDNVLAVVKGSAVNHGGRANGYFVPNPVAQEEVIRDAVRRSGVDPRTISYVEAHGTGTALGDPIEVEALTRAYGPRAARDVRCAIGSVKGNIGHLESAAGIAQLQKVLLQLRDGRLYPSRINAPELNPEIPFDETPFVVQQSGAPWRRPVVNGTPAPRRAGVSSFGVGGVNVHIVLEEPPARPVTAGGVPGDAAAATPLVVPLSARDDETLDRVVELLHNHLRRSLDAPADVPALRDVAWTLQTGRVPHARRLAVAATSTGELVRLLAAIRTRGAELVAAVDAGQVVLADSPSAADAASVRSAGRGAALDLARRWVSGDDVAAGEWRPAGELRRVSLPGYPFARQRYVLYGEGGLLGTRAEAAAPAPRAVAEAAAPEPEPAGPTLAARLHGLPDAAAATVLTDWLQDFLTESLGFTEGRKADVDTAFFDLGLESVALRATQDALQRELDTTVDFQLLFDHPTIAELATALVPAAREAAPSNGTYGTVTAVAGASVAARPHADDPVRTLYLAPRWVARPAAADTGGVPAGPVLVFDPPADAGGLAASVPDGAGPVVVVRPGAGFRQVGSNHYQIDPAEAGDYERLLDGLDEAGLAPGLVVHGWALAPTGDPVLLGGRSVIALSRALSRRAPRKGLRLVVAHAERDGRVVPELAGVAAFARSLAAENPLLSWRSVGVAPEAFAGVGGLAEAVWAETLSEPGDAADADVRLGAQRLVAALIEVPEGARAPAARLRAGATVLVTGGLGGVGTLLAEHLAATRAARVVLTGRSAAGGASDEAVRRIEAAGGQAIYVPADVADRADMVRLLDAAHAAFGPVHGVLHAAGVTRDGYLRSKEGLADLDAVLRPKVRGARVLDEVLAGEPLDVVMLFSSLTARFGNAGQTDYAYANGVLEAFAHEREARRVAGERSGATVTVDWPFWADGGMKADAASMRWLEENLGLVPLERADGIAAFDTALRHTEPELVVVHGHDALVRRVIGLPEAPPTPPATSAGAVTSAGADASHTLDASDLTAEDLDSMDVDELAALLSRELAALEDE
ncbi:SDR family NAD(P)-dependent oxidoreductase [Amycolatopsis anabasis]|uniref:SDR family NAD(P)-dependent oxidoreductase n=1 Tax=Amycolatopsis anabasis TaxID=1840409 RepID=UPI00131B156C|nr:SDR family NAD(P)-dependent oxidoreductase [Amycolatopsis anabasis]